MRRGFVLLIIVLVALCGALTTRFFIDHDQSPDSTPQEQRDSNTATPLSAPPASSRPEDIDTDIVMNGKNMDEDTFFMPGIGDVQCFSAEETVNFSAPDGVQHPLTMKVFYDSKGNFLRAEYIKEGSTNYEGDRSRQERNYRVTGQSLSLANRPSALPLEELGKKVYATVNRDGPFENATRLNITYVNLKQPAIPAPTVQPVYIVNVFGVGKIKFDLPDDERLKRIRYVFDEYGNILFSDNTI
jgi:hypothetical protein